jgi:hypothetical protein
MKAISLAAMALTAMTSAAMAEPRKLGDDEMAEVTAGLYDVVLVMPITVIYSSVNSTAVGVGAGSVGSNAGSNIAVNNIIGVNKPDHVIGATPPASSVVADGWWSWAHPRTGMGEDGVGPLRMWSMITDMLRSKYLGRGW